MKLEDLLGHGSFEDMSDDELRDMLQQVRHNRIQPVATTSPKARAKKEADPLKKLKKLGLSEKDLLALLEKL